MHQPYSDPLLELNLPERRKVAVIPWQFALSKGRSTLEPRLQWIQHPPQFSGTIRVMDSPGWAVHGWSQWDTTCVMPGQSLAPKDRKGYQLDGGRRKPPHSRVPCPASVLRETGYSRSLPTSVPHSFTSDPLKDPLPSKIVTAKNKVWQFGQPPPYSDFIETIPTKRTICVCSLTPATGKFS